MLQRAGTIISIRWLAFLVAGAIALATPAIAGAAPAQPQLCGVQGSSSLRQVGRPASRIGDAWNPLTIG
jgi:hypothetical protein